MFAISTAAPASLRDLQEDVGDGVMILSDPQGAAIDAFGMRDGKRGIARAGVFLVDRDGVVRAAWPGDSYRERPSPDEILARLR